MKKTIALTFSMVCTMALSQSKPPKSKRIIQTETRYVNHKLFNYDENDKNGNTIFSRGDGVFAEGIKNLNATDYDSLNRPIREYFAHSNAGFSVSENVYEGNQKKYYEYVADTLLSNSFNYKMLDGIHSRESFINSKMIQAILKSPRQLHSIDILNEHGDEDSEIFLSEKGDTTGINTHRYNDKNQEVFFRMYIKDSGIWNWDIYNEYDDNGNEIRSYRLEKDALGNIDTTEVYHYGYDSKNRKILSSYFNRGRFRNKTEYRYNKKGQLEVELFYDNGPGKPTVRQTYFYDATGKLIKKITKDSRSGQKSGVEIYSRKTTYW